MACYPHMPSIARTYVQHRFRLLLSLLYGCHLPSQVWEWTAVQSTPSVHRRLVSVTFPCPQSYWLGIIRSSANDHMIWLGDFNRHHPLWEADCNRHLYNYPAALPLINLIADYGMIQLLPCGILTLQSTSTGNWTCPDNVFSTEQLQDAVTSCNTDPDQKLIMSLYY